MSSRPAVGMRAGDEHDRLHQLGIDYEAPEITEHAADQSTPFTQPRKCSSMVIHVAPAVITAVGTIETICASPQKGRYLRPYDTRSGKELYRRVWNAGGLNGHVHNSGLKFSH